MLKKIKHWFWWKFKATEKQKMEWQFAHYGTGIMRGEKFVDVRKFYIGVDYGVPGGDKTVKVIAEIKKGIIKIKKIIEI